MDRSRTTGSPSARVEVSRSSPALDLRGETMEDGVSVGTSIRYKTKFF